MKFPAALLVLTVTAAPTLWADVTLSPIIGSHMVLQRDMACPIWGWADAGEEVTVEFAGQKQTAKPDAAGKWMVKLAPMKASAEGAAMTITGKNKIALDDVVVGEVWLCSGQSNMEFTVGGVQNKEAEIAAATDGLIRHIKISNPPALKPADKVISDGWKPASPATVGSFAAVGYFFGREVKKELNVPIGLLGANWGGTRIEPWTPPIGFKQVPALKSIADKLDSLPDPETSKAGETPKPGEEPKAKLQSPLALFNGRIAPLVPYALRGALWYQGEANSSEGMLYLEKMKALIGGWRDVWQMPDMPFYYVQLAPYVYGKSNPENLARLWEAQTAALQIPHTGMAVTTDIGNPKDIHPKNKQEVGRRLALWALTHTYGKSGIEFTGPLYKSVQFDGGKATITLEHAAGLKSRDGQPLTWFTMAGEDKNFVPAKAEISGDKLVVTADGVTKATAVRFGFSQEAEPNLCNGAGLPASPFRTDDWPVKP